MVDGLASKPLGQFLWFDLKTSGDGLLVEPQNQGRQFVVCLASKPSRLWFIGCATKLTGGCISAGHMSRCSGLLHVEASLVRVSQAGIKTGGGVTADGAYGTSTEVASESS
jgi:hypothetical protein